MCILVSCSWKKTFWRYVFILLDSDKIFHLPIDQFTGKFGRLSRCEHIVADIISFFTTTNSHCQLHANKPLFFDTYASHWFFFCKTDSLSEFGPTLRTVTHRSGICQWGKKSRCVSSSSRVFKNLLIWKNIHYFLLQKKSMVYSSTVFWQQSICVYFRMCLDQNIYDNKMASISFSYDQVATAFTGWETEQHTKWRDTKMHMCTCTRYTERDRVVDRPNFLEYEVPDLSIWNESSWTKRWLNIEDMKEKLKRKDYRHVFAIRFMEFLL